jgi:ADP-ribose pyrophosphatase
MSTDLIEYTHPDVFTIGVADGWAEPITDPATIDWPARQALAVIPFDVVDGRPLNPCASTGIRFGRNEMGFWGENLMADSIVTVTRVSPPGRFLLMIERRDGNGFAVPGGHVESGESGLVAALRELQEETGLVVSHEHCRVMPPRYVADPRSSDEAWAVTIAAHISLTAQSDLPAVHGGDDALRAVWVPALSYGGLVAALSDLGGTVFAAHVAMLQEFLGETPYP